MQNPAFSNTAGGQIFFLKCGHGQAYACGGTKSVPKLQVIIFQLFKNKKQNKSLPDSGDIFQNTEKICP
jgi:hypothetical protein